MSIFALLESELFRRRVEKEISRCSVEDPFQVNRKEAEEADLHSISSYTKAKLWNKEARTSFDAAFAAVFGLSAVEILLNI